MEDYVNCLADLEVEGKPYVVACVYSDGSGFVIATDHISLDDKEFDFDSLDDMQKRVLKHVAEATADKG